MAILQNFPGVVGLFLRSKVYPNLFGRSGRGVFVGRNVTFAGAKRIELGNRIIIDDNAVLDAGRGSDNFIRCGDDVEVSRNAILACEGPGTITLGNFVSIGRNASLSAQAPLEVGDNCSIGPYACVMAGEREPVDLTVNGQDGDAAKGIVIEENVWIGAHVTVMDGVRIGASSVIAVGSVVVADIPPYTIAAGSPARMVRRRKKQVSDEGVKSND